MRLLAAAFAAGLLGTAEAAPPRLPEPAGLEFKPPKGDRHVLSNGIEVYLLADRELPLVKGTLLVRMGGVDDPAGKGGLARLLAASMRAGGSSGFDADKLNARLEFLAASVETGSALEHSWASFDSHARDLSEVLDIFADVVRRPAFREDKLKVERQQILEEIRRRNDDPSEISRREGRRLLFGAKHPYGRRLEAAEVSSIARKDLAELHGRAFKPKGMVLSVSGDFDGKALLEMLEARFGDWKGQAPGREGVVSEPAGRRRVVLIAKDNVTQTSFRVVQTGIKRHDPDYFAYMILDDILGGSAFSSRLFTDVRSRQGLAYGVGSGFAQWADSGMILAACGTRNDAAILALREVLKHLELIRSEPVLDEELKLSKDSISNSFVFKYQTPEQIIDQRAALDFLGYPADWLDTYLDRVNAVSKDAVLDAGRRLLKPGDSLIVVVGPSSLAEPLKEFGSVEVRRPD